MELPAPRSASRRDIFRRMNTHRRLKVLGLGAILSVFFCGYFLVLLHPRYPVTVMPATALDRLIGFHPALLPLYLSLWAYVSLPPFLLDDRRELIAYGVAASGLCLGGLAIFFFWPTSLPPLDLDWTRHPGFGFLKAIDRSGNACPSLHVAFAVFSAMELERCWRRLGAGSAVRLVSGCWAGGILYSTLAVKQHVAVDVVAGAALGAVAAVLHGAWARRSAV